LAGENLLICELGNSWENRKIPVGKETSKGLKEIRPSPRLIATA
jgi:hypothetical protein